MVDPPTAGLLAVDVEGDGAAFADAAAVVGGFGGDLVVAGGELGSGLDLVGRDGSVVVGVGELAVVDVQRPTAAGAALVDDHPCGAASGDGDLGGGRVGLVEQADQPVLVEPAHARHE